MPANTNAIRGIGLNENDIGLIAQRFADLDYVFLNHECKITDKSISDMSSLKCLRQIIISDCSLITDEGVKSFQKYPALKQLFLHNGTQLTRRGLQSLAELKNLELLYISNWTKVKASDVDELRKALPSCTIKDTTGT